MLKDILKDQFFKTMRRAFDSDEGKRSAVSALGGLFSGPPIVSSDVPAPPYEELGCSTNDATALRSDVIFVTGRFRSGSTLMWNLFRNVPNCVSYYEPFNERQWFDPSKRGERVDSTHRSVDVYWNEFEGLTSLKNFFCESWNDSRLYMDRRAWDPKMKAFICEMIRHKDGDRQRPVLQFNRLDFRLPWVRQQFPNATIVHLYRHPRDQWCSVLQNFDRIPPHGRLQDYPQADGFYTRSWASDLKYHFPFLDERNVDHLYELHYYLWKLSYIFGQQFGHQSVCFEELTTEPQRVLVDLFQTCDLDFDHIDPLIGLISPPPFGKWKKYADDAWFRDKESKCEDVLSEFFG
jgi:hypothetical protein